MMDENCPNKVSFNRLPFDVIAPQDQALQLGLVTLETDLTIENEFRHFLGDGALSLIHTRIDCDDQVTADNLTMMEDRFAEALSLFPPQYAFDAVGYGCTSASLLIGEDNVEKIIKSHIDTKHVTTPMTAVKRGLSKLGARNIGYMAPYISDISQKMCDDLSSAGFSVVTAASFDEGRDSIVGCISPRAILAAITAVAGNSASTPLDAIFVACTSLKCAPIIAEAEASLGIPVISSNSALAWDMARLTGLAVGSAGKGALYS
jgi:maleate isomerase